MAPDATDDPLQALVVERVERPDGRYLLYYAWPRPNPTEPAVDRPTDEPAPGIDDV